MCSIVESVGGRFSASKRTFWPSSGCCRKPCAFDRCEFVRIVFSPTIGTLSSGQKAMVISRLSCNNSPTRMSSVGRNIVTKPDTGIFTRDATSRSPFRRTTTFIRSFVTSSAMRYERTWSSVQSCGPGFGIHTHPQPQQGGHNWVEMVNEPQTELELRALRHCVNRGTPYGDDTWIATTSELLGLESTLRLRGRPRTKIQNDGK